MNILIHTMHITTSIGASLQACALGKFLTDMGYSPQLLYYVPDRPLSNDVSDMTIHCSSLRDWIAYLVNGRRYKRDREAYLSFKTNHHVPLTKKYTTAEELVMDPPAFDAYLCGSDQVWNPNITQFDPSLFFHFVKDNTPKISYAASIGCDDITDMIADYLRDGVRNMTSVSVREDTAVQLLQTLCPEKNIIQNIDPTFLLPSEQWHQMATRPQGKIPEHYVLYYPMGETDQGTEILFAVKEQFKMPCVSFNGSFRKSKGVDVNLTGIGPGEFLYLCEHADAVVTNSFHGFALSINFKKRVVCFKKPGQHTRMESLSRLLHLNDLMVTTLNEYQQKNWEEIWSNCYDEISTKIENEKKRAEKYLREALSTCE